MKSRWRKKKEKNNDDLVIFSEWCTFLENFDVVCNRITWSVSLSLFFREADHRVSGPLGEANNQEQVFVWKNEQNYYKQAKAMIFFVHSSTVCFTPRLNLLKVRNGSTSRTFRGNARSWCLCFSVLIFINLHFSYFNTKYSFYFYFDDVSVELS